MAARSVKADIPVCFQEIILSLSAYWAARGCAVLQPYDMEVGAGTFHPATLLRALGPEEWNVAYVAAVRVGQKTAVMVKIRTACSIITSFRCILKAVARMIFSNSTLESR